MYLHKEGHRFVTWLTLIVAILILLMALFAGRWGLVHYLVLATLLGTWGFFTAFFRIPNRKVVSDNTRLIAPADGTVCVIEEVNEKEYIHGPCLMVSVFMHGYNVHVNRYPTAGTVDYVYYHKGNYFNASYPKSSEMNEHSSIGMVTHGGTRILMRQIAGVMARRICLYAHEGDKVQQNQEFGFIKFGSRVDLFLPLGTPLLVKLGDNVKNSITPIAELK